VCELRVKLAPCRLARFDGHMRFAGCVLSVFGASFSLGAQELAELRFARVFGDHMVLQRGRPMRIWGTAVPGQEVEVRFGEAAARGTADAAGGWVVLLPAQAAEGVGRDLQVTAGTSVVLHDIVVGDVWLCSGQSNMAMGLDGCDDPAAIAAAGNSAIRYRPYFEHFAGTPQTDLRDGAEWRPITKATAGACTAVGYWFANAVQPVAGVPIGLLECTVGGTEIECWMPPAAFSDYPENTSIGTRLREAVAEWQRDLVASLPRVEAWLLEARAAAGAGRALPPAPRLRGHPNEDREHWVRIQSLWNGMVHPIVPFGVKGVLWYQGENNGHEQAAYVAKLRALIETWRAAWGQELPFYIVQLPNFGRASTEPAGGDLGFAPCRMAQLLVCSRLSGVGIAVTIDIGDAIDIHPKNKREVGERLARWALRNEYGQQLEPCGPLFREVAREGGAMRVRLDHVGSGLMVGEKIGANAARAVPEVVLRGFSVAGADRQWHWASAQIDGDSVLVRSSGVPEPVAVRYAHTANPVGANLYNREGLPASPFRSDDW